MKQKFKQICTAAILAAFTLPAMAEAIPKASTHDSRIQTVTYQPDQVYHIRAQIGRASMVQLEEGETLSGDNAALGMGDADAWKVAVKGNNIIFKPTVVRPETNLLISTNKRTYAFSLSLASPRHRQSPTYILRFSYPDSRQKQNALDAERMAKAIAIMRSAGGQADKIQITNSNYWGYGDKTLAPTAAWDNGRFTYFSFNNGKDLPTIYKILPDGTETLVNAHIESDTIVVHETGKKFILRLGKSALGIDNRGFDAVGQFNHTGTGDNNSVRIAK